MHDAHLTSGIECSSVEGIEDVVVGALVRLPCRVGERRVLLHKPLAVIGEDHPDVRIRLVAGQQLAELTDLGP
jgi:hypothetical protein